MTPARTCKFAIKYVPLHSPTGVQRCSSLTVIQRLAFITFWLTFKLRMLRAKVLVNPVRENTCFKLFREIRFYDLTIDCPNRPCDIACHNAHVQTNYSAV